MMDSTKHDGVFNNDPIIKNEKMKNQVEVEHDLVCAHGTPHPPIVVSYVGRAMDLPILHFHGI